ncbi:MAG: AAA-like domain-containing protein [Chloroflexota bacterium]
MREFNIFGPVYPDKHYHVDRKEVKADLRDRIERGRYITLNAGRQTGKTTIFREVITELEATGDYFGILIDFEMLAGFDDQYRYEELGFMLARWREQYQPTSPDPKPIRHQGDFVRWLRTASRTLQKKCVLIIDEFDALGAEITEPILSLFRGMYLDKNAPNNDAVHSIILVGVRNIASLLQGTQSPFNIADQFTVPYFSKEEILELYTQYSAESNQAFALDVIESIVRETEGQPFLVNRLAQLLTQDIVPDRSQTVTRQDLDIALVYLVNENNSHFASITSKAIPHRQVLLPMLFYNQMHTNLRGVATVELIMYGVLRVVDSDAGGRFARVSNPIYRKILILTFAPSWNEEFDYGDLHNSHIVNGTINFGALLEAFKAFMTEHGVRLLKSAKSGRPLEISGQYLLLSYLSAALNSVQGTVTIESVSTAGEMDILAFYRGQRFIVETKIWRGNAKYEEGKAQLLRYLTAAGLATGYLLIFDENLATNPVKAEQGEVFDLTLDEKIVNVYLVSVKV